MMTTASISVHPSNAEALRNWNGSDGSYWVTHEATFDASVRRFGPALFAAAAIGARDRVLDIGCGTGETTRQAARLTAGGEAVGIDLSAAMLARARQRADEEGLRNVSFVHGDAQIFPFASQYDVAISRTGVMFFGLPRDAFTNIAHALRPGGRVAWLVWRDFGRNDWVRDFTMALAAGRALPAPPADGPGPFSLADPARVHDLLDRAGFSDIALEPVDELMFFGATADEAYHFVRGLGFTDYMLEELDEATRTRALDDLRATIEAHATDDGVLYPSSTWIVTATR